MIFWFSLVIILIILSIISVIIYRKNNAWENSHWVLISIFSAFVAFVIILASIACRLEYIKFIKSFEIQRTVYNEIIEKDFKNNINIVDILNANQKLSDYKADYTTYGIFTITPKSVMDIKPIGLD